MSKKLLITLIGSFLFCFSAIGHTYTEDEAKSTWNALAKQRLTEENFRKTCDFIQEVGQTSINLAYGFLAEYFRAVQSTGNNQWAHVLLMNWARAKESLSAFDEADSLYRLARANAPAGSRNQDETLVGTVLMYLEWDKRDSLEQYLYEGEATCRKNQDKENLSFILTFKAMTRMDDTAFMRENLDSAILLAQGLSNKNALFTAAYNRAVFYSQFNLEQQVTELSKLLELTKDPSLSPKPRLYDRTGFYFRNPAPSIYYQLMLVNLLLTDYVNAGKFAESFYDATVKPSPNAPQSAGFNAVMAMVKEYQGSYGEAWRYLQQSTKLFGMLGNKIAYPTYFLAAGMFAEHKKDLQEALNDYERAYKNSSMAYGLHLMSPEIYYAHALILNGKLDAAQQLFSQLEPVLKTRTYSAIGYYYYKYYAELLKARGDQQGYAKALETFYSIKDSLSDINRYRAIQEVETKMHVHDKEAQIDRLNSDNASKQKVLREQWVGIIVFTCLFGIIIALLVVYARNQNQRKRQAQQITRQQETLQQHKILEMQKQHRIEVMQGAIDAEENERRNIADQLHDETGAMLALASLNLSSVLEKGKGDERALEKIETSHDILNQVASRIRDISHQLTPLVIEKFGFKKAIEDMDHAVNLSQKLKLQTVIVGFDDDNRHPVSLLNNIFRIVQELIHNILKHAHAQHAVIELVEHEHVISVVVEDDGLGFNPGLQAKGKGLQAIRSKIAYLNGQMEIQKKKNKGTLIVIEINV